MALRVLDRGSVSDLGPVARSARNRRIRIAVAMVGALAGHSTAAGPYAQTGPAGNDRTDYHTVVRAKPHAQPIVSPDTAGFTTRISIDASTGVLELGDVLRQVPGVLIKDYGAGQAKTLTLRGADPHQVGIFLDGIRLTAPGHSVVDLSLFDPSQLATVDVRRTASSAQYGASAIGGALILETPRLRNRSRTTASVGYGSWNTLEARLSHRARLGQWRYLSGGSYRQSDGDFAFIDHNGIPSRRVNNDSKIGELLLKVDRLSGSAWQIGLLDSFGAAFRGAPGTSQNPSSTARQRSIRNLAVLRTTRYRTLSTAGRLNVAIYHRYDQFRFRETAPPPVLSEGNESAVGSNAELVLPLGKSGRLNTGLETCIDLFSDPDTDDRQRVTLDVFASSEIRLHDGHVVIAPAVRLSVANAFDAVVVPKLGLKVRPFAASWSSALKAFELLASLGRSYRRPDFQQLYLRIDGFAANPNLRPEDALNLDTGVRWRHRWVSAEVAYFHRWLNNTIITAPVSSFLVRPDNYSRARTQGLETAVQLTPGRCLSIRAAYTYTWSQFGQPPLQLPGHPRHRLTTGVQWAGQNCQLSSWVHSSSGSASAEPNASDPPRRDKWLRWLHGLSLWTNIAAQGSTALDRFNNIIEEGRVLWDAGGSYSYRWLTLAVTAHNLLDKRDAVDTVGFPLPARSIFISTRAML